LEEIEQQEERLSRSRKRLMIVQEMDSQSRRLIADVRRGIAIEEVVKRLTEIVYDLAPSLTVDIRVDGIDLQKFDISHAGDSELNFEEMALIISRAREVLDMALARDRQIQELNVQKNFDALTGLPNRGHFTSELESMQATVEDSGETQAVLLIDVDRFREINNSLGYSAGDALLREVGARLQEHVETNEVAARLSADEFGVAGTYPSLEVARERANDLAQKMHFHTALDGHDSAISVCAGSAFSQGGMLTAHELSRRAALAIFLAKSKGDRGAYTEYDEAIHSGLLGTWQEEIAIREALRAGEFKVYFQPIVSAETEKPVGVEALIRWERPGQGTMLPDEFLPTINRAGLASEVGNDVLIKSLECWVSTINPITEEHSGQRMYVSINTEAVQLEDAGFADFVIGTAGRLGVPMDAIVLEVTEHALSSGEVVTSQLQRLRSLGARVALDDFGTGYSNLGQAKKLPMDILKIDKSFLEGIEDDIKSQRMVADVTQMAKGQNLKVTVEGVESNEVRDILRTMGINNIQGWLYSKALPPEALASWLHERS
jgi:diguanylate cyclase (GGDEF)-like protein